MGAIERLKGEHGSVTGSLTEVLVVVPMMLAILAAIMGMTTISGSSLASNRAKYEATGEAQQTLDRLADQLRRASSITYKEPVVHKNVPAGTTNSIKVTTLMPGAGPVPQQVTYTCLKFGTPLCAWSYGSGASTKSGFFFPNDLDVNTKREQALLYDAGNDQDYGVFRLFNNGAPVTTDGAAADRIQLRFKVCVNSNTCNKKALKSPMVLTTTVAPRNVEAGQ